MQEIYDPATAPDPDVWLALEEMERLVLVLRFHGQVGVELPNAQLHALIHVVVENQSAIADETPVAATLERLVAEGLDRHEAIHAVGSVLAQYLWELGTGDADADPTVYFEKVKELTAQQWLEGA